MSQNKDKDPNPHDLSRRQFGLTLCASTYALVSTSGMAIADVLAQPTSQSLEASLHTALLKIDSAACQSAASELLATSTSEATDITLHLRSAGITAEGASLIASALTAVQPVERKRLRSFSLSYNDIGDDGAISLADALPESLDALGLVGCSITDRGANALLQWASSASGLRMICIESNQVSQTTRNGFAQLRKNVSGLSVYI